MLRFVLGVRWTSRNRLSPLRRRFILSIGAIPANQKLFDWTTDHEHNRNQHGDGYCDAPCSEPAKYACDGRDPHRRGGRQPVHVVAALTSDDHTGADEADPGDNALDDPAGRCKLITAASGV